LKILDAFAAAQVDPAARWIDVFQFEDTGVSESLLRGRGGKAAVDAAVIPAAAIRHKLLEIEVFDLGREGGRETAGVEVPDRRYTAPALNLSLEKLGHTVTLWANH